MTKFFYDHPFSHFLVIIIQVLDDNPSSSAGAVLRKRLFEEDFDLTTEERQKIRHFLDAYPDDE